MPDCFVISAFGSVPTRNVSDRNTSDERGLCGGKDFEPVPVNRHHVGFEPIEHTCKPDYTKSDRRCNTYRRIRRQHHLDFAVDFETIAFNLTVGQSELRRKMSPGCNKLQLDFGILSQRAESPVHDAILGTRPRYETYSPAFLHDSAGQLGTARQRHNTPL